MTSSSLPVSPYLAVLPGRDLRRMIALVRLLYKLSKRRAYRHHLDSELPASALCDPGHDAVMMGYDFHLTESGPKLIEVNTNAGGLWYASQCYQPAEEGFGARLGGKLVKTFCDDYARFRKEAEARPKFVVILDENPEAQPLYAEMRVFAALFEEHGISAAIAGPEALEAGDGGLYYAGKAVDMIYNRHCDFYLQTPAMAAVRAAYLGGEVCLSPNPRAYGLLADKRRMLLWCRPSVMRGFGLSEAELALLAASIPETRTLASLQGDEVWRERKQWVFKPGTGYASRGVYVGDKLTKHKLAELDPDETLLQRRIAPSLTLGADQQAFKTDFRLFVYRNRVLGVAARIYQGQVTNLRTENGGFARVCLAG